MKEIWKDIKNYEGLYQVSNLGKIKNSKGKILKGSKDRRGYLQVKLYNNKKYKMLMVHRLVGEVFLLKSDYKKDKNETGVINSEKLQINHIDGNKLNNKAQNLEWCSNLYNFKEAIRIGLRNNIYKKGKYNSNSKAVIQCDLKGNFIKEWDSMADAKRELGFDNKNISTCVRGKSKSAYGYIWKYK